MKTLPETPFNDIIRTSILHQLPIPLDIMIESMLRICLLASLPLRTLLTIVRKFPQ